MVFHVAEQYRTDEQRKEQYPYTTSGGVTVLVLHYIVDNQFNATETFLAKKYVIKIFRDAQLPRRLKMREGQKEMQEREKS